MTAAFHQGAVNMNYKQMEIVKSRKGFIAALDQSGGSTPKALALYGIPESQYSSKDEMFDLVHKMRTRIITSSAFNSDKILGAILFEQTMDRKIEGKYSADYLYDIKGVVPFLKVDKGLEEEADGVQLMKPITDLEDTLRRAKERNIFGTKMRSVIKKANKKGIKAIVDQQFDIGKKIIAAGLVPIIEPEVDIKSPEKARCEDILKSEIKRRVSALEPGEFIMLKLSIPTESNLYKELLSLPNILRIVALSGGYSREEANTKLAENSGIIASFSRALAEGLNAKQSDAEFNAILSDSIDSIYDASVS